MNFRVLFIAISLFIISDAVHAQIWELTSHKYIDMATKATHGVDASIFIDSSRITITMGEQNFYYDITEQMKDGENFIYRTIDKNDYTVTIAFSPSQKMFDCKNPEGSVRYILDKVVKPVPPINPEEQAKLDSIKKIMTDSLGVEEMEDTIVYDQAEVMAEYPGGKTGMMDYLLKNVRYPKAAKEKNIRGFVTVVAIVEKDGTLSQVTPVKDIGGGCGQEAVRVVKSMPNWSPAEDKGATVRMRITISVNFMK